MKRQVNRLQEEVLASANAKAALDVTLEEIRKRSEEDKAVWQREREEMQQQVNRLQEDVLAAANANSLLEEIRVQQNDHINKLLSAQKMKTTQETPELDAERPGKKDALQQHVTEQTKKRLAEDQNAVPLPSASPPNKKQKQNVSDKACDADSFFAQLAGLSVFVVQQQACAALRSLAGNAGNQVKIAEAGGIEAVVAAM